MSDPLPLLRVRGLVKAFPTETPAAAAGKWWQPWNRPPAGEFRAVDGVDLDLMPGETLGIVGESGSGKTTVARCILRALRPSAGQVEFRLDDGQTIDLATLSERELVPLRQQMQMIFQDPFSSLNPRMTVGDIVGEPLMVHGIGGRAERREKVVDMLERVGLKAEHLSRYPHAFSGGQRQRIGIARALILRPRFVVADEAVSALDVSVQAQVLALLKDLQAEFGLTYLFVSHDLSVVRHVCDRVAVMYRGRVMEQGDADRVFTEPRHAYTRVLLSAIPYPNPRQKMKPMRVSDLTAEQLKPLSEV